MNAEKARSDSIRPRETDGGLEAVVEKVVECADVEVLDFEEGEGEESPDELPEADGEVIEADESEDECAPNGRHLTQVRPHNSRLTTTR